MLRKMVGIISYFPDDVVVRTSRKHKLDKLLKQVNVIFKNIKVVIIAQNWTSEETFHYSSSFNDIFIFKYPKLGITGARETLRNMFLKTEIMDYVILIDDDIELIGTDGTEYLKQIDDNPDCLMEFTKSRHQLMAVSRYVYSRIGYDTNIRPEDGDGFEDRIFFNKVCKLLPEHHKVFKDTGLHERGIATQDKDSTWCKNQNIKEMLDKTFEIINNIGKES